MTFNGTIRDSGVYKLGTHNGDIRVGLGGANNATIFVRTFQGDFAADFPVQLPDGQNARSGSKRFNFTLGSGSARIELQSFGGDIVLARKAITSREDERQRRRQSQTPQATAAPPAPPGVPSHSGARRRSRPSRPALTTRRGIPTSISNSTRLDFDFEFEHFEAASSKRTSRRIRARQFGKDFERNFEQGLREELREEVQGASRRASRAASTRLGKAIDKALKPKGK